MSEEFSPELLELLENDTEGLFDEPAKPRKLTSDDRLDRAFIEVLEFYDQNGREPSPDTLNIAERKLGARLVGIRADDKKRAALAHLDDVGLLDDPEVPDSVDALLEDPEFDDEVLGSTLSDGEKESDLYDVSILPKATRKSADSVAKRKKAKDFDQFRGLFKKKHEELRNGAAALVDFPGETSITEGKFYLLKGALVFVAEVHDPEPNAPLDSSGKPKARLRLIFENGTESAMYVQSFAIRLYEEDGKVLARTTPIQTSEIDGEEIASGYIYVLRSLSDDPDIKQIKDLYKIGFTTGTVEGRIQGAEKSATYLFAPVEIVATYKLYNVKASAVEAAIHRAFSHARLEITAQDPNSLDSSTKATHVTEWFVAPLESINEVIEELFAS